MLDIDNNEGLNAFLGDLLGKSKEIYTEYIEEIKKEHNLKETNYKLEIRYFTTYLYIQKYVYVYVTDPNNLKMQSNYIQADNWIDFKEKVKEKAKSLILNYE